VYDDIHRELREANPGREAGVSAFFQVEVAPMILFPREFDYFEPFTEMLAQRFTVDEIGEIQAFFETSAGQKLLQELPSMRMEINTVSAIAQRKLRAAVLEAIVPRAEYYGLRLPAQQE
jgi:hypothetical protein